jgi:hypothetical protein
MHIRLDRCRLFARQANVQEPALLCWDIENMIKVSCIKFFYDDFEILKTFDFLQKEKPLHERLPQFDLIHVSRYLHRPLMESIKKLVYFCVFWFQL